MGITARPILHVIWRDQDSALGRRLFSELSYCVRLEMKILLIIGAGGFIGTILRYSISQFIQAKALSAFPFGTLAVNIIGCFVIGIVFALSERTTMSAEWRLFLATGICGGFTTFSAFSSETFSLLREGQIWYASAYVILSLLLGILATFVGYSILRLF